MTKLSMGNLYAEWWTFLKGKSSIKKSFIQTEATNVVEWILDRSKNAKRKWMIGGSHYSKSKASYHYSRGCTKGRYSPFFTLMEWRVRSRFSITVLQRYLKQTNLDTDEAQAQAQAILHAHAAGRGRLKAPMLVVYEVSNAVWQANGAEASPAPKPMKSYRRWQS